MKLVEAIKCQEQIQSIGEFMEKHNGKHYKHLWDFGLQCALRITDLLSIKFDQIKPDGAGGHQITLKEKKTKKTRIITLNVKASEIVNQRRTDHPDYVYLFQSKARNVKTVKPLSRQSVAAVFKEAGDAHDVSLGTHSMRKTRGFHLYRQSNDLALVQKLLNHSNSAETLRYIGMNDAAVQASYHDLVL